MPDVRINGAADDASVHLGDAVAVTVQLNPRQYAGTEVDLWIIAATPAGWYYYASDYNWYPGWKHWGCPGPMPYWWPDQPQPPELVADQQVSIGPDG
ncbi:MAG: hypothetical protein WCK89_19695, partial [bacterium]